MVSKREPFSIFSNKKGWCFHDFRIIKRVWKSVVESRVQKRAFNQVYHPVYKEETIKGRFLHIKVWVSAERNFISNLNQFQMMANVGKVNLYHMTKFHISIDSLSSCFKAVLSTRIDFSSFYLLNIYSSNYQPESVVCRFSLKRDSKSLCPAGVGHFSQIF